MQGAADRLPHAVKAHLFAFLLAIAIIGRDLHLRGLELRLGHARGPECGDHFLGAFALLFAGQGEVGIADLDLEGKIGEIGHHPNHRAAAGGHERRERHSLLGEENRGDEDGGEREEDNFHGVEVIGGNIGEGAAKGNFGQRITQITRMGRISFV